MTSNNEMTDKTITFIQERVPKFKVISKEDSWFHRMIGFFFPPYRKRYWTTIGFTAAYPNRGINDWRVLLHEGLHGLQAKRITRVLFGFLYLFPQSLFPLFILLGILVSPWWLLGLVCLGPLPAPFRKHYEMEGYKISAMLMEWTNAFFGAEDGVLTFYRKQFTGPSYYFMWPFKGAVIKELNEARVLARAMVNNPTVAPNQYVRDVFDFVVAEGRMRTSYKEKMKRNVRRS